MDQNSVSLRQGIPFYMGIASIATGMFLLSASFMVQHVDGDNSVYSGWINPVPLVVNTYGNGH